MLPSKKFTTLRNRFFLRLFALRSLAENAPKKSFQERDRLISYATIECQTLLANFFRAYFLSCALKPITVLGTNVTCAPNIQSAQDALTASMRKIKPRVAAGTWGRRDEPPWHKPITLIDSCDAINCSHYVSVTAAFSIPTSAFDDLIPFRNFFAHRNDHTVNLAKAVAFSYSISQLLHPTDILCSFAYGRHQILLLDWLDDFQATAGQLCE